MSQSASTAPEIVERALALSKTPECMVVVTERSTANLRWAGNSLTTNAVTTQRSVTVLALVHGTAGTSAGVMERTGASAEELEELVRAAERAAASAQPAEDAQPLLEPAQAGSGTDWDAAVESTSMDVLADFARSLGGAFNRQSTAGHLLYGFAEHEVTSTFLGTSSGLRLRHDQPTGTVEINAKTAAPGTTGGHSTWVAQATRDFTDVNAESLEGELERRISWGQRQVELPAGRYETLLPPSAVADFMVGLYRNLGARDAVEGRTVFSTTDGGTRLGAELSHLPLTLYSDPTQPGLECAPFVLAEAPGRNLSAFDNGLAIDRTEWISQGRLSALAHTRHSAQLTGQPVTPFTDNLLLNSSTASSGLDDMIASTERGLLLTCLWYIREVDPQSLLLTGLTRDGVYLVEDGEVTAAVNNFRFNESPVGLLERAVEAGTSQPTLSREFGDYFSRTAMPALRIADFNMSTVSQAS
ncbi:metallopeptidase TldD-related protein [Lipingzhangella sp. LS1_29]|uniref:Metallopeptidase TldD-related protein n=1 Tax=Lipingzhangella rawalii TaxID=2055835 RepID=A0ABU2H1Z8_9ACTN|nr:metallopeptidase TldD-related protein [Lipingzhangella rawalii]MDS1268890.1 metallopeptidase TldD-related protein [Lipingzhangella rawalii]